jgi:hypothetical protein
MSNWIQASGILQHSPPRPGGKKRVNNFWLTVKVPKGIVEYYHHWIQKRIGPPWDPKAVKLQLPMWGGHITVLDGRTTLNDQQVSQLQSLDNRRVTFEYSPDIRQHWKFYYLPVRSKELDQIRRNLGFTKHHPYHITVGRLV